MANKAMIATGLLGQYIGDLMQAGFERDILVKALRVGAKALEDEADLKGGEDVMSEITKMMDGLGYKQDGPARVFKGKFGVDDCNCPKCVARRRRGADHQDERNDI